MANPKISLSLAACVAAVAIVLSGCSSPGQDDTANATRSPTPSVTESITPIDKEPEAEHSPEEASLEATETDEAPSFAGRAIGPETGNLVGIRLSTSLDEPRECDIERYSRVPLVKDGYVTYYGEEIEVVVTEMSVDIYFEGDRRSQYAAGIYGGFAFDVPRGEGPISLPNSWWIQVFEERDVELREARLYLCAEGM